MNKKLLPVIVIVAVVVIGVGLYFFLNPNGTNLGSSSPEALVADALSGRGSVKCEYDEEGRHMVAYMKNGMIRTEVSGGEEGEGGMIMKDNTTWTWQTATKQGFMYKAPDITPVEGEDVPVEEKTDSAPQDSEEIKAEIERYKDSCKSENIPDSMFQPPADITFQDYSQMMQQFMPQQ